MNVKMLISAVVFAVYLIGCDAITSGNFTTSPTFPSDSVVNDSSTSSATNQSSQEVAEPQYLPWYCAHKQTLINNFIDVVRVNQGRDTSVAPASYLDINGNGSIGAGDINMMRLFASLPASQRDSIKAQLVNYVRFAIPAGIATYPQADINGNGSLSAADVNLTYHTLTNCFDEQLPIEPPKEGSPAYCAGSEEMLESFASFIFQNRTSDASASPLNALDFDQDGVLSQAEANAVAYYRTLGSDYQEAVKAGLIDFVTDQQGATGFYSVADINQNGSVSAFDINLLRLRLENCF